MAFPVVLGIPWLAGLIGGLFASIFGFFAKYVTHRLALVVLAVSAIVALTAAFVAALSALLGTVAVALPEFAQQGIGLVFPSNMYACLSVLLTAHLLRWAYEWNVKVVQLKLF